MGLIKQEVKYLADSITSRLLAEHKTVQRILRAECVDLATYAVGELPTQSEIKQMTYLDMVLREGAPFSFIHSFIYSSSHQLLFDAGPNKI